MTNKELADIFNLIADLLQIKGEVVYKVLAYRKAAESLTELGRSAEQVWRAGELESIPGVGKAIADKIDELLRSGRLEFLEHLTEEVPRSLAQLLLIPDLGPKKVNLFWRQLGITTLEELREAAENNRLADLPGMGQRSQQKVLEGIQALERRSGRMPLGDAWPLAQEQLVLLRALPGVSAAELGGSLRRMRATIGDIDILAAADDAGAVMETFASQPSVVRVEGRGETKTSVEFANGLRAQLWLHPPHKFGTALQFATGSKDHNVRLRELALSLGYSLSEHSLKTKDGQESFFADEHEVYRALGIPWIAPELREDRGEVQAAKEGRLPELIEEGDVIAELHCHSDWSDGQNSILEMAQAAIARGRKVLAITDHSSSLTIGNGLSVERLMEQKKAIAEAREQLGESILLLHGTEMEIRADGRLDFPDEVLAELDMVVAALHVSMRQPRAQVTERMLNAIHNPYVRIIAHPTNRLLPDRQGADLDMEAVLQAAAETGTALEINANPQRLDLDDIYARRAIEMGVKLAVDTDAHRPQHLDYLRYGVATARRAWAQKADVINAWTVEEIKKWVEGGK